MVRANEVPDKSILQKLNQKLARLSSGSRNKITAAVHNGEVTLSGSIQFEQQRRLVLRAAGSVPGIRRVIDQLQLSERRSQWT